MTGHGSARHGPGITPDQISGIRVLLLAAPVHWRSQNVTFRQALRQKLQQDLTAALLRTIEQTVSPRSEHDPAMTRFVRSTHNQIAVPQTAVACSDTLFPHALSLATNLGIGIEIQAFMQPSILNNGWRDLLIRYQTALQGANIPIHLHGAFLDLSLSSPDPILADIALLRYQQSIEIAARLNACSVIFHSNYSPLSRYPGFPDLWIESQLERWRKLTSMASQHGILLLLENVWDDTPDILLRLIRAIDSPNLQGCLDVGHVQVFSRLPVTHWIEVYGSHLAYLHINNNDGVTDLHWPLFNGLLDYTQLLPLLFSVVGNATVTLEVADYTAWPEDIGHMLYVQHLVNSLLEGSSGVDLVNASAVSVLLQRQLNSRFGSL